MFLVGGFSESPILQDAIREEFKDVIKVIIPQVTDLTRLLAMRGVGECLMGGGTFTEEPIYYMVVGW